MRLSLFVVVGLLVACSPTTVSHPSPLPRTYPIGSPAPSPVVEPGIPTRLQIAALNIDSPVMVVGLMADGSVGTPCDPTKPAAPCNVNATAWYTGSARPGAPGSAVIDGHVDWYGPAGSNHDIPAVFANLKRIQIGDMVNVADDQGVIRTFVVDAVTTLPYPQQPAGTYAVDGPAAVTLITCEGAYINRSQGMSSRVYVHATLIGGVA